MIYKTNFTTIKTRGTGETNDLAFQSDYITPIGKYSTLETGVKFESRNIKNYFLAEQLINGNFETIDNIDNTLEYEEKISAAYLQLNTKMDKFSYQLGLRFEASNIAINASDANLNSLNKYS